jgi:hypothetical protein
VTLAGDGEMNSKKVALEGDYAISWKTLGDCYYSASLKGGDTLIGPSAFTADAVTSGTGNIYDLKATDYYLDVITGPAPTCGWSVTLAPVPWAGAKACFVTQPAKPSRCGGPIRLGVTQAEQHGLELGVLPCFHPGFAAGRRLRGRL